MPVAIVLVAIGGVMVASALTGQSIADTFRNFTGGLNPAGGRGGNTGNASDVSTSPDTLGGAIPGLGATPTGKLAGYKGPNATVLEQLHSVATGKFHLRLTNLCRSAAHNAAVGGSKTSFHLQCRAGDYVGTVADRVAFARYAKPILDRIPGGEVFCDQAGMVAPGFDHSDHTHIGA
jgi:Peptidase M15